jgi:hypothetical protein
MGRAAVDDGLSTPPEVVRLFVSAASTSAAMKSAA